MFLIIIFFSLWCPVGGELVGLLFLHLSWVPGPEGGIPRNVGGDHQWPDTKGGVRPHSHDLLPQEVTLYTDGTEAALRTRKRGARKVQGREEMCWEGPSCWPAPCRSVCQRPRTGWKDLEKKKEKKRKFGGEGFDPAVTTSGLELWIVWEAERDTPRRTCDKCDKASRSTPMSPCPKDDNSIFYGDKAIHFLGRTRYIHYTHTETHVEGNRHT